MSKKTILIAAVTSLVLVLIAAPPVSRTAHMVTSADGLLFIASLSDENFSFNPWSRNCYLIRQDTAVAILKRFGYPYRHRSPIYADSELPPLIYQAVRARGVRNPSADRRYGSEADQRLLELIRVFIRRKQSVNQRWDGYLPIHMAILFGDVEVVELLIENEADLHATIDNPGKAHDGMNSSEFAGFLSKDRPEDYEQLYEIIKSAESD